MNRRDFFRISAAGVGTMVLFSILPKVHAQAETSSLRSSISANHGHQLVVTQAELFAAGPATYGIQGDSGHGHEIEVTKEILETLSASKVVEIESTSDFGHSHIVRIEII